MKGYDAGVLDGKHVMKARVERAEADRARLAEALRFMMLWAEDNADEFPAPSESEWAQQVATYNWGSWKGSGGTAHRGDCTKEPFTCLRCCWDDWGKHTKELMAALASLERETAEER